LVLEVEKVWRRHNGHSSIPGSISTVHRRCT
jgi:hypothetical protein